MRISWPGFMGQVDSAVDASAVVAVAVGVVVATLPLVQADGIDPERVAHFGGLGGGGVGG